MQPRPVDTVAKCAMMTLVGVTDAAVDPRIVALPGLRNALRLFEQRQITLVQAARLAAMPPEEFVALLGAAGIPAVDYPPEELDDEVGVTS